jgi:hypothetical protein
MSKLGLAVLTAFFFLVSCGMNSGALFYPKNHNVAFKAENGGTVTYLNWGDKLLYLNKSTTNTNSANQIQVKLLVKHPLLAVNGWVDEESIVKNPLSRGVILNSSIVRDTPSDIAKSKQAVEPPVLVYILEMKDNTWAYIKPYSAGAQYYLPAKANLRTPLYNNVFASIGDISTNEADILLTIALQLSTYKYNDAKRTFDSSTNVNKDKVFADTMNVEVKNLQEMLSKYPIADPAAQRMIEEFTNTVIPSSFPEIEYPDDSSNTASSEASSEEL